MQASTGRAQPRQRVVETLSPIRTAVARVARRRPLLHRAALRLLQLRDAVSTVAVTAREVGNWLATSREATNYTYDLTAPNLRELEHFLALFLEVPLRTIRTYVDEILHDDQLAEHLRERARTAELRFTADSEPRYARRVGWYAVARALCPKVVVETGVDKGLGTCVLAAALLRNATEGHPGQLIAIDIEPTSGWLLGPPYSDVVDLRVGDSQVELPAVDGPIDLFIHDSNHSYDFELAELETVLPKMSSGAVLMSDNSYLAPTLLDFAERIGRPFWHWREVPQGHFFRGGGIGAVRLHGGGA